jgi:hypothetical protein
MSNSKDSILSKNIARNIREAAISIDEREAALARERLELVKDSIDKACMTKDDLGADFAGSDELRRLFFESHKYDNPISSIKRAIQSGANIINVVSPGCMNSPAKEITDLIVQTALQGESNIPEDATDEQIKEDRDKRSEERKRSVVSTMHYNTAEPDSNAGMVEEALLGGRRFNELSSNNVVIQWCAAQAGQENILSQADAMTPEDRRIALSELHANLARQRQDDIIYDINNDETYFYMTDSIDGKRIDIGSVELDAQRTRTRMKEGDEELPQTVADDLRQMFLGINAALGNSYSDSVFPVGASVDDQSEYQESVRQVLQSYRGAAGRVALPAYDANEVRNWASVNSSQWPEDASFLRASDGDERPASDRFVDEVFRHITSESNMIRMISEGTDDSSKAQKNLIKVIQGLIYAYRDKFNEVKNAFSGEGRFDIRDIVQSCARRVIRYAKEQGIWPPSSQQVADDTGAAEEPVSSEGAVAPEGAEVSQDVDETEDTGNDAVEDNAVEEEGDTEADVLPPPDLSTGDSRSKIMSVRNWLIASGYTFRSFNSKDQINEIKEHAISSLTPILSGLDNERLTKYAVGLVFINGMKRNPAFRWNDFQRQGSEYHNDYMEVVNSIMSPPDQSSNDDGDALPGDALTIDDLRRGGYMRSKVMVREAASYSYSDEFKSIIDSVIDARGVSSEDAGILRAYIDNYVASSVRNDLINSREAGIGIDYTARFDNSTNSFRVEVQDLQIMLNMTSDATGAALTRAFIGDHGVRRIKVVYDPSGGEQRESWVDVNRVIPPPGIEVNQISSFASQDYVFTISEESKSQVFQDVFQTSPQNISENIVIYVSSGPESSDAYELSEFFNNNSTFRYSNDDDDSTVEQKAARRDEFVRELNAAREKYGIKKNVGILPNWAPDPYDFRLRSSGTVGHPNNLDGVNEALQKRLRLRWQYQREMDTSASRRREKVSTAIGYLNDEINEITQCIQWASRTMGSEIAWSGSTPGESLSHLHRDSSSSALRYQDPNSSAYYKEVKNECQRQGLNIPTFGPSFGLEEYLKILTEEDSEKLIRISSEVGERWRRGVSGKSTSAPTYVILHNFEQVGKPGEGDEGNTTEREAVSRDRMRDILTAYQRATSQSQGLRSAAIFVGEEPLPDEVIQHTGAIVVNIDAHMISGEEIIQYIGFFEDQVKNRHVENATSEEEKKFILRFAVPTFLADRLSGGLSGLNMGEIKSYLKTFVDDIYQTYVESNGSRKQMTDAFRVKIEDDIMSRQANSAIANNLNLTASAPVVNLERYLTKSGSAWDSFVSAFGETVRGAQKAEKRLELINIAIDTGIAPVSVKGNNIKFATNGAGLKWMPLNGNKYPSALDMEYLSNEFDDVQFSNVAIPDSENPVPFTEADQMAALEAMRKACVKLKEDVHVARKQAIPNIIFLYGEPGSGKSIFPEVMANELGLSFRTGTMTEIFLSSAESGIRGQAERRLSDFLSFCRTSKNTVILIDEFHKFFDRNEQSHSIEYVNTVLEQLQTYWQLDLGTYTENNFYIVCAANKGPDTLLEEIPSFSAMVQRFKLMMDVEVPSNVDSIQEFFMGDTLLSNIIEQRYSSNTVISKILSMIDSYRRGDLEAMKNRGNEIIREQGGNSDIFLEGLLMPRRNKRKLWQAMQIDAEVPSETGDELLDKMLDFVEGWDRCSQLFNAMAEEREVVTSTGKVVTVSPMKQIAYSLSKKMEYEVLDPTDIARKRDIGRKIIEQTPLNPTEEAHWRRIQGLLAGAVKTFAKGSVRHLNDMATDAIMSHNDFECGDQSAMPLNWKTLWIAAELSLWTGISDEGRAQPNISRQYDRLGNPVDGWKTLKRIAKDDIANVSGIDQESFMSDYDIEVREKAIYEGVGIDDSFASGQSQTAKINHVISSANSNLGIGTSFVRKMTDLKALAESPRGNSETLIIAQFFGNLIAAQEAMASAIDEYESSPSEDAEQRVYAASNVIVGLMREYSEGNENGVKVKPLLRRWKTLFSSEWLNDTMKLFESFVRTQGMSSRITEYVGENIDIEQLIRDKQAYTANHSSSIFNNADGQFDSFIDITQTITDELAAEIIDHMNGIGIPVRSADDETTGLEGDAEVVDDLEDVEEGADSVDQVTEEPAEDVPVDEGIQPVAPSGPSPIPSPGNLAAPPPASGQVSAPSGEDADQDDDDDDDLLSSLLRNVEEEDDGNGGRSSSGNIHIVTGGIDITEPPRIGELSGDDSSDYLYNALLASGAIKMQKSSQVIEDLGFEDDETSDDVDDMIVEDVPAEMSEQPADISEMSDVQDVNKGVNIDSMVRTLLGMSGLRRGADIIEGKQRIIDISKGMIAIAPYDKEKSE